MGLEGNHVDQAMPPHLVRRESDRNGSNAGGWLYRKRLHRSCGKGSQRMKQPDNSVTSAEACRPARTVPERLLWISDFLALADRAISILACVEGIGYPPNLHRTAQHDLGAWASYLDSHPSIAARLDLASRTDEPCNTRRQAVPAGAVARQQPRVSPSSHNYGPTK